MADRRSFIAECDHMRQVVRIDGEWVHINVERLGSVCSSAAYKVEVTINDPHNTGNFIRTKDGTDD